ncbi:hypothetical protein Hanom_Chr13g01183771 [Helianthus anomalus]
MNGVLNLLLILNVPFFFLFTSFYKVSFYLFFLSKVHTNVFTKILGLVSSFLKVHKQSLWFAFCNVFSPQVFSKVHGLAFYNTYSPNLKMLKPLDLLVGTKCVTKCKPQ